MLDRDKITEIAQRHLLGTDLFLVEVKAMVANEFEILIDSDGSVTIEACMKLNRSIEMELDRETEDFALTVASAGIGQPLKVLRQYTKLTGKPVEVVLKNGTKIIALLKEATPENITLSYEEKVAVEGEKRKKTVETVKTYTFDQIKSTIEYLDFK